VTIADEYKEMMLQNLNDHAKGYEEIYKLKIPNSVDPALLFDPVLPGMKFETERKPMRISKVPVAAASAPSAANAFVASSYDALVDAPVELGEFDDWRFEANGARYRVIVDGADWDRGRLDDALRRIIVYETTLMGGAPFEEYTFIFHIGPANEAGSGGMEHANSTAIAAEGTGTAAAIAAHEFFHVWNVKRIRPQSLEPVDYTREQYTRALWFAEGVTSTYALYALTRSGLWGRRELYSDLAADIAELDSHPARLWQSVEQSSLDAWLEKYAFYRRPQVSISYYNKGKILGVLLDLAIRNATDDHASLDDVLRALNRQFARRGLFYRDSADLRAVSEQVCGCKLEDFFSRYVAGTDEIQYADFLSLAGLKLRTAVQAVADFGFWPGRGPEGSILATDVQPGSSAEAAGVHEGDALLALDGATFPRDSLRWLRQHAPGETVRLRLRQEGKDKEVTFKLGRREEREYAIEEDDHATAKQLRIRDGLLQGKDD
jgi:predicted metalloprotease with PDZ domain